MHRHLTFLPLLLLLFPAAVVTAQGAPKAVPVEPIKNFEMVAKGEALVHVFKIRNDGDSALEISDVRPACGCTVTRFDKTVAPGATGEIFARLDTTDLGGPISKSIAVFTNDPENAKLQLVMKAKVKPFIGVDPGFARYIYVQGEATQPIRQTLWAQDGTDIDIKKVTSPYDYLEVNHRVATEKERNDKSKGKQWVLEFTLAEDAPVGALRQYVEIETDHARQPNVKIPISGFVRPRQHITPMELDFGELQTGSLPIKRTFQMTSFITKKIEVTKVETDHAGVTADVSDSERDPGHRFRLLVVLEPDMPKGDFDVNVKVHTTDPTNPVITLPIRGKVL